MLNIDSVLKGPDGTVVINFDDACEALLTSHGEMSATEALTRAFVAERKQEREGAFFWIAVYQRLVQDNKGNLTVFEQIGE